jgi:hypothetical protein
MSEGAFTVRFYRPANASAVIPSSNEEGAGEAGGVVLSASTRHDLDRSVASQPRRRSPNARLGRFLRMGFNKHCPKQLNLHKKRYQKST